MMLYDCSPFHSYPSHELPHRYLLDPRLPQIPLALWLLGDHFSLKYVSSLFVLLFGLECEVLSRTSITRNRSCEDKEKKTTGKAGRSSYISDRSVPVEAHSRISILGRHGILDKTHLGPYACLSSSLGPPLPQRTR